MSRIVTAVASVLTVPVLLGYLGPDGYGLWVASATLMAWVGLANLGVPNALLSQLASAGVPVGGSKATLPASAWWVCVALIGVSLAILLAFDTGDVWGLLFNATGSLASEARLFAIVMWIGIALSMPLAVPLIVLRAAQRVDLASHVETAGVVARVAAILAVVELDLGVGWLAVAATGASVGVALLASLLIFARTAGWPRPSLVGRCEARGLLATGTGFLAMAVAGLLVTSTDVLIVAQLLGPAAVPTYSVAFALLILFMGLLAAVLDALWPAYSEAASKSERGWIERTHRRVTLGLLAASLVFAVTLTLFGQPLIQAWAGAAAVPPQGLLVAFGITAVLMSVDLAHGRVLVALGHVRRATLLILLGAAINIPMSVLLGVPFGVTGVAMGTTVSYAVTVLVVTRAGRAAIGQVGRSGDGSHTGTGA